MKKITLKIFKFFLLTVIAAIFLEAGTRVILYVSLNNYINKNILLPYRQRLKEINLFPVLGLDSREIKFDPMCYYILREGFFRGPDGRRKVTKEKRGGEIRIIALGDSTTYGIFAPYSQSWPAILEESLKKTYPGKDITVLNAGIPGASSRQLKRIFQKYLIQYNPDIVIWRKYAASTDSYELKDIKTRFQISLWRLLYESRIFRTACLLIDKGRDWKTATANRAFDFITNYRVDDVGLSTKEIDFSLVKRFARENNVPYVLAVDYIEIEDGNILNDCLRYQAHNAGPVVYTCEIFKEKLKDLPMDDIFIDDCHLTSIGRNIIAQEVHKFIVKEKWIDSLSRERDRADKPDN